jgi:hypothetical protein
VPVGSEVITAVVMKFPIFLDTTVCTPFKVNRRFEGTRRLLFLGRMNQAGARRLSAKLVLTFADREVSHGQCGGSPTAVISVF